MRRRLSGIKPTGKIHLGNYFGAIKQYIDNQDNGENFYFIADYHALTTTPDPKQLAENKVEDSESNFKTNTSLKSINEEKISDKS